jgi:serine/threonine protein kinase/Tol biopolymer transport system component
VQLTAGDRIGPYEIVAILGRGGMGEVYRARDTKLGRDVALKILPAAPGSGSDRIGRFEREARLLAALNHPNIATLYGVEDSGSVAALIMELVEGDTLAECLVKARPKDGGRPGGPLPIPQALAIARQIADALAAAHDRGIVHRDLKPSNVKMTPAGIVKVLDFGLAKLNDPTASHESNGRVDVSQSPTVLTYDTRAGLIIGTAPYMSPEQARGLHVDKRTDLWAFGCVLYEMLTGRQPFPGDTVTDIIVSILGGDPDWTFLPGDTPSPVRRLLRRCLSKDPQRRLHDVADARLEIDDALASRDPDAGAASVVRVQGELDFQRITDTVGIHASPAISPDGKMVAFVGLVAGKTQIWVRLLAGGAPLQLTHDDVDHFDPRWAPDSSTLIFYTPGVSRVDAGTIWEIGALGGWPRPIAASIVPGDISHDGRRIALLRFRGTAPVLMTVARDDSDATEVAVLPTGRYWAIRWSPDDRMIAVQRLNYTSGFEMAIDLIVVRGGERREITRDSTLSGFSWLPDSSGFIYSSSRGSTLLYPPACNLRTIARDGSGDRALTFGDDSYINPDAHASDALLVSRLRLQSDIWRFPVAGTPSDNTRLAVRVTRQTGQVQTPSISPDGTRLVYVSDNGGHANLWVAGTDGSHPRQITFETERSAGVGVPKWSPRGDLIAFVMNRAGQAGLWAVRPDGTALRSVVRGWAPSWSGDGRWLYFWRLGEERKRLEKIPVDGGQPVIVREENVDIVIPSISSDGGTLYFVRPVDAELMGMWWGRMTEFCKASPEDAAAEVMASVPGERNPGAPGTPVAHVAVSPDGQWLATSLVDGGVTNIWLLPTAGGPMQRVTDFGDRPTLISRSVSWSPDSQHIYAAVAEAQANIVLLKGLIP